MSILDALFGGLFGSDDQEEQKEEVVERPCSNCPGYCKIAPEACSVCEPYKEQMIDAIYWVEHKDELLSRYEVTGVNDVQSGAVTCPYCGGHSDDPYVCEYCGSKLAEGNGKIKVASASDIPNPVLEAQEIIFKRYEAVKDFDGADEAYGLVDALSGVENEGLLSSIFNALLGSESSNDSKTLGNKMSESEIGEMAAFYGVSVADYLAGLDIGKYLAMSNKKTAAKAEEQYMSSQSSQQSGGMSGLSGLAGLAGMVGLGSMLFGGSSYNYDAARKPSYHKPTVVVKPPVYQTGSQQAHNKPYNSHMPKPYRPDAVGLGTFQQTGKPSGSDVRPPLPGAKPSSQQSKPSAPQQLKPSGSQSKPSASNVRPPLPGTKPSSQQSKPSTSSARPPMPEVRPMTGQSKPSAQQNKPSIGGLGSQQISKPSASQPKPSAQQHRPSASQPKPKVPASALGGAAKVAGKTSSGPKQADKLSEHLKQEQKSQDKIAQKLQGKASKK